jgi:hypothetical protein
MLRGRLTDWTSDRAAVRHDGSVQMQRYLSAIERAASHLIPKVWEDDLKIADAEAAVKRAEQDVEDGYRYVEGWLADPYVEDDEGLATMVYWETYFERTDEQARRQTRVEAAAVERHEHEISSAMLAGMVLELAKRGITMVHGGLQQAPAAPKLGALALRDVIWQARNQAMHWEDGKLHPATQGCFDALFAEHGQPFDQATQRNLSVDVLRVLGWTGYEHFAADLSKLA